MEMMFNTLGRFVVLVDDCDQALAFYQDTLGFEVLHDQTAETGLRFLHVGVPGQLGYPPVGLWLLKADSEAQSALVGKQAGGQPLLVLYADDCRDTADRLEASGVTICRAPYEAAGATVCHILDLYGNEIVVVQLPSES